MPGHCRSLPHVFARGAVQPCRASLTVATLPPPTSASQLDLFCVLIQSNDRRILRSAVVQAAVAFKWEAFGRRHWIRQVTRTAALVVSYCVGLLLVLDGQAYWSLSAYVGLCVYSVAAAIAVRLGWEEYLQLRVAPSLRAYWSDLFNLLELLSITSILLEYALLLGGLPGVHTVGAAGVLLLLVPAMQACRGNELFAFLVKMLELIIVDMVPFVMILAFVVISVGFALRLLKTDPVESGGIIRMVLTAYNMMTMADFEQDLYTADVSDALVFTYATFFVNVVLLNALIAIMGDSYDKAQDAREETARAQRGQMMLENQQNMREGELADPELFPRWVHAIVKRNDFDEDADEWAGRVKLLRSEVRSSTRKLEALIRQQQR